MTFTEPTAEHIILDEDWEGFRNSDNFSGPLIGIFETLESQDTMLRNKLPILKNFLRNFVFEKKISLEFTHDEKTYTYRTMQSDPYKDEPPSDFPSPDKTPPEYILRIGECRDFFRTLVAFQDIADVHKTHSNWFEYLDVVTVWERATYADFAHPKEFLERIQNEIRNGGLPFTDWTEIGEIPTKSGTETVTVLDTTSTASYVEGPRTLHISSTETPQQEPTDAIHSVIYGIDTPEQVTIYSIQLDPVEAKSTGRMELTELSLRRSYHLLNDMLNDEAPQLHLQLPDNVDQDEIPDVLQRMSTIKQFVDQSAINSKDFYVSLIERTIVNLKQQLEAPRIRGIISDREDRLKRFNTVSGGAAMVSFATALALFRARGVNTIRIPTYLPRIQHIGNTPADEVNARITNDWLMRLRILQSFIDIPIPEEDDSSSYVTVDLRKWDGSFRTVNKDNRQLVPLLAAIKTSTP